MGDIDNETKIFQNSIRYLHNISTLPETNVPTLKSFICLKRRLMELRRSSFLPTSATKPSMHCQKCFLNFFEGPATYNVISKPTRYTFGDKVKAKQKNGLPLTRYQEKYLKRMKKFTGNILVTKCKFCNYENKTKLDKPRLKPIAKISLISSPVIKKKKKNKRDKFCGLNQSIVASVSLNSSHGNNYQGTPDLSKTFIPLTNNNKNNTRNEIAPSIAMKKKKKNKKDTFCGLNQSIVASGSPNNNHGNPVNQSTPGLSKTFSPLTNNNKNNIGNHMTPSIAKDFIPLKSSHNRFKNKQTPDFSNKFKPIKSYRDAKTPEVAKTFTPSNNSHNNSKHNNSNKSNKLNTNSVIDLTKSPFSKKSTKKNTSEVINLDSDESFQELHTKRKIKKKQIQVQTSTPLQTPIQKKNSEKYRSKLSEIFKNVGKKKSSSTNLMQFLQGL
ncbi:uncharacterized protein [Diabrotica undecimpunctata]|uniref:uncharacterized protein n=1 Tax=Diabrotica undecimpunctata TaxID=50387 RepID=UPI003B6376B0